MKGNELSAWDRSFELSADDRAVFAEYERELLLPPRPDADFLEPKIPGIAPMERDWPRRALDLAQEKPGTVLELTSVGLSKATFEIVPWGDSGRFDSANGILARKYRDCPNTILEIPTMEFVIIGASESTTTDPSKLGVIQQYADLMIQPVSIKQLSEDEESLIGTPAFQLLKDQGKIIESPRSGRHFVRDFSVPVSIVPTVVSLRRVDREDLSAELVFTDEIS